MKKLSPFKTVLLVILVVLVPFWLPLLLRLAGYYVNEPGWYVAKIAVERSDINLCSKILVMPWLTFLPTAEEQKQLCIHEYAEITMDASICDQLLPDTYAMSCIGAASNSPHGECDLDHGHKLTCAIPGPGRIQSHYEIDQIDNCEIYSKYNNRQVIAWCYAERAHQFGEIEKCLEYAVTDTEKNYCYYQRATMLEDLQIGYCDFIQDRPVLLGCQAMVNAWTKYPELKPAIKLEFTHN